MFCQRCWTVSTVVVILTVSLLIISCAGKSSPTEPEVNELPASVVLAGPEDVESTSLVLRWSSSSESDFAEYRLFMSETAGVDTNSTLVATIVSATDTSTAIEDLVPETTYYFVIYVLDQAGQSTASNVVSATLLAAHSYLYVSNADGSDVSVILAGTDSVVATIPPSYSSDAYEPRNLAISPDGTGIAVPFRHSDNVWVIEKDTWTSVMVEDVSFYEPYAATYTLDGTEIWVVNKKGAGSSIGSITIINAASLQVIASIEDTSFSSPEGITVNDTHAFVVNKGDGSVARVNISTRLVDGLVNVGGEPRYAVVSPDNTFLYVSAPYSGIYKIRTSDLAILANYTESLYSRNMAISSDGSVVYTALQNNSILTIDTSSGNTSTISFTGAGSTYGVALIERTGRGYVTDEWWDRIYVFDLVSGQELPGELIDITELNTPRSIAGR